MEGDPRRYIRIRYAAACSTCGTRLAASVRAWWHPTHKTLTCSRCKEARANEGVSAKRREKRRRQDAGASAQREHDRRRAEDITRIRKKHPILGGSIVRFGGERQSTRAWSTGAAGERRVAKFLEPLRARGIVVLHDLGVPGSTANIDHIVVAPAGLYVIDAKRYKGKVEMRDKGGFFRKDMRLYVGGRDRSPLAASVLKQSTVVHGVVEDLLRTTATVVTPILCFVEADWPLLSGGYKLNGVRITWPKALPKLVQRAGPLSGDAIREVEARVLSRMQPA